MRVRDYLGFPLLAIGMSISMLGHQWLGLLWVWGGALVMATGLLIVMSGGMQAKIYKALRRYREREPGGYGNIDHDGPSHGHDFGGAGDGDD